jgi:hypothetical protein
VAERGAIVTGSFAWSLMIPQLLDLSCVLSSMVRTREVELDGFSEAGELVLGPRRRGGQGQC